MAKNKGRDIAGIVLLDKPQDWSSNKALQKVKWLFQARKAGHTGTLDPFATGLLPICFGKATKISQYLLDSTKAYTATIQLGVQTDTADKTGQVIAEQSPDKLNSTSIKKTLQQFTGSIDQLPPMYSALKHQGKPLYQYAREGVEVQRSRRVVEIAELVLLDYDEQFDQLQIYVKCSKGTYVRTLAEDIAQALNTVGHLVSLERNQCGVFTSDQMYSLDELMRLHQTDKLDEAMVDIEQPFKQVPLCQLDDHQYKCLSQQGRWLHSRPMDDGLHRIYYQNKYKGIVQFKDGEMINKLWQ